MRRLPDPCLLRLTDLSSEPVVKKFTIKNRLGLHARAAAVLVALTSKFSSSIVISKEKFEIDGKSILGVLSLAAIHGTQISVTINGDDSETAMDEISVLIESGFGEGVSDRL